MGKVHYPIETDDTQRYRCDDCMYAFLIAYKGWYPSVPCIKCGGKARIFSDSDIEDEKNGVPIRLIIGSGLKDNITAIGYDDRGREVAITDDKKLIPVEKSIYDPKRDKWGWAATGKKVKGYAKGYKPHNFKK